jgi:hypothetical protein
MSLTGSFNLPMNATGTSPSPYVQPIVNAGPAAVMPMPSTTKTVKKAAHLVTSDELLAGIGSWADGK